MQQKTFFTLFFLFLSLFAQAQKSYTKVQKDSLWKHYMVNGASKYFIHNVKYQSYLDTMLTFFPKTAYLWQQKAMPLYKAGKYELGAVYLDKAVELDSKEYLNYRGFMKCIFSKQHSSSIEDFKRAQALYGEQYTMDHPNNFFIGLNFLQLNQLDSAKLYFERCNDFEIKLKGADKDHRLNSFYLAIIAYEKTNYEEAIVIFDKVLAWYSNFSDAKFYKGVCLQRLGKTTDAKALFQSALEDIKKGYSIVEDNTIYEKYPYQVSQSWIEYNLSKDTTD